MVRSASVEEALDLVQVLAEVLAAGKGGETSSLWMSLVTRLLLIRLHSWWSQALQ